MFQRVWSLRAGRKPAKRHLRRGIFEVLEARRVLASADWTGGGDGTSWSDPANWSGDLLPGPTDNVVISAPAGVTVVHASGTDAIKSLSSSSPVELSGGTLTVAGTVEVDNTFTIAGGTLGEATVKPGSGGEGITFTNQGGTLDGVTVDTNLDLATNSNANVTVLDGLTLNNATVYIGNRAGTTYGDLYFGDSETLGGSGTVVFGKSGSNSLYETSSGATLVIGPNITIRGSSGTIGGYYGDSAITNQGAFSADDSGGGTWSYDHDFNDNQYDTASTANAIDTSGVTNPAPPEVYQTARSAYQFGYTLGGLAANTAYTLRLHFADFQTSAAGQRLFDVNINGAQVLSGFDIFATAGGANKAVVEQFPVTTDAHGQVAVSFATDGGSNYYAQVNGLEIDDSSQNVVQTINAGELAGGTITVSPPSFTNHGTMSASNGEALTLDSRWTNAGGASISANGATLNLGDQSSYSTNEWTNTGTIAASNGSTVNFGGQFTLNDLGTFTRSAGSTVNLIGTLNLLPVAPSGLTDQAGADFAILNWTNNSTVAAGVSIERSTDGVHFTQVGTVAANVTTYYDGGLAAGTTYYYRVQAYNGVGSSLYSNVVTAATSTADAGLLATFYNSTDLSGTPVLARVEGTLDDDWGSYGSPGLGVNGAGSGFSAQWQGRVQAQFSETYTFSEQGTGAVKAWVNGQLVINTWDSAPATPQIALTSGQDYSLLVEYQSGTPEPSIHLSWSSPSTPQAIIPASALFAPLSSAGALPANAAGPTVTATGGSTLSLDATTGDWKLLGGVIAGGTVINSAGGSLLFTNQGGTLEGVTLEGNYILNANDQLHVVYGLAFDGATVQLGNAAGTTYGQLLFDDSEALGGSGTVVFGKSGSNALYETSSGGTLTIGPNITIRGSSGTIGGYYNDSAVINQGTISADDSGGGTWSYDHGFNDNQYDTASTANAIDTSGVTNPAPQEVYQTARSNYQFGYTLGGLAANTAYTLRLHFADFQTSAAGQRLFDVGINGTQVLSNFDIFATAAGANKAVVEPFPVTTDANGQVTITFATDGGSNYYAQVNGLEIDDSSQNVVQMINAGELAGGTITITPPSFTNRGTLSASNAEVLTLDNAWTNASGATISANGATLNLGDQNNSSSNEWSNAGTIAASNGSTVNFGGQFTLHDLGTFTRSSDSTVNLVGTLNLLPVLPSGLSDQVGADFAILNWTNNSTVASGVSIERSTDDVHFTQVGTVAANVNTYYDGGLSPGTTYYYRVQAYNGVGGSLYSNVATAVTSSANAGLLAAFYNSTDLNGSPVLARVEGTLDDDWGYGGSPGPGVNNVWNGFSAEWQGQVQAEFSETYAFSEQGTGAVKVWVNGQLVINTWDSAPATPQIALTAGQDYSLLVEYQSAPYDPSIHLSWSSPSTPQEIIPANALFAPASSAGALPANTSVPTVAAGGGGTLSLDATTGNWNLAGGVIAGGTVVNSAGGGLLLTNGGALNGVTLQGNFVLNGNNQLHVINDLTLDGATVDLGNAAGTTYGQLLFDNSQALGGSGTVVFGKGGSNALYETAYPNGTLTIGPNITVRGSSGTIDAYYGDGALVNQGTIAADDSGGGTWSYDHGYNDYQYDTASTANAIDTSGVTNPAPQEVYQTARSDYQFGYTLSGLTPNTAYALRLHFADFGASAAGQRLFDVSINGTQVLSNFDIVATAGGANKAVVEPFSVTSDANGQVTVNFATDAGSNYYAMVNGLEIEDSSLNVVQTINAGELAGGTITINPASFNNQGTMSASNGESLTLDNGWTNASGATISADDATLNLGNPSNAWTNNGTITATNSTVNLGGSFTNTGLGTFNRSGGAVNLTGTMDNTGATLAFTPTTGSWNLLGGDIKNGTLSESGGAELVFTNQGGTLDGVTADSNLDLAANNGANVTVLDGLTLNNATVYIGNAAGTTYGDLYFGDTDTLGGSGAVVFGKGVSNALYETGYGDTLTIGRNITIRGSTGTISAYYGNSSIINQGTIAADDSGGGTWSYDHGYRDYQYDTASTANAIDTSGVTNPAPQEVYQTARSDYQFGYTLSGLTPNTAYTLRLHFADFGASAAGQRLFDVSVNGTQVLSNFDIFFTAGGTNKAVVEPFPVTSDANGQVTVNFATDAGSNDYAMVNGLEIDDASQDVVQTINAGELAGGTITISPVSFTNQGSLAASNGEVLTLDNVWANASGSSISADNSTLNLGNGSNAWTNDGTITATNASTVNLGGEFTLAALGTFNRSADSTVNLVGRLNLLPVPPTGLTAAAVGNFVVLSWTDNSDLAAGYDIERSTDDVNFTRIGTVGANAGVFYDAGLTNSTTYYYRVRAYSTIGNSLYSTTATATAGASLQESQGLAGYWPLNGSVSDQSGGGYDAQLVNGASFTSTPWGQALSLQSSQDEFAQISGDNSAFNFAGNFSMQAWIQTNPGDTSGMFPLGKHYSGYGNGYFLAVNDVGDGGGAVNDAHFYRSGSATGPSQTAVNDGQWHQLIGVYIAATGTLDLYVDGVLQATGSAGVSGNDVPLIIGGIASYGTPTGAFTGLISQVGVWDRALSPADVLALYVDSAGTLPGNAPSPPMSGTPGNIPGPVVTASGVEGTLALDATTGSWNLAGGSIYGGVVSNSVGGSLLFTSQGGTLDGVALAGTFPLDNYANVHAVDGLTLNNATLSLGNASGTNYGALYFDNSETLGGSGTIVFGKNSGDTLYETGYGDSLTIGPNIAIRGSSATIGAYYGNGTVINQGTIAADDSGGGTWGYDHGYSDYQYDTASTANAIDTSGVTNPAPPEVYQTARSDYQFGYTLSGLTPNTTYTLRLHFADFGASAAGQRLFDVSIDGTQVLSNFDIFATAGGANKAVVEPFPVTSDANGQVTVNFATDAGSNNYAMVNGLEIDDSSQNVVQTINAGEFAGGTITINPASFTNQGSVSASNGETLALDGAWTNIGGATISANDATLNLGNGSNAWNNGGTITAANNSTVNLGGSFTNASVGSFSRSGGTVNLSGTLDNTGATLTLNSITGSWNLVGGDIKNGALKETDGAELVFTNQGGTLDGVTADSNLDLATNNGTNVTVVNGLTLSGATVYLGNAAGTTYGDLYFGDTETLGGSGTVLFGKGVSNAIYETASGDTLTIGPGVTIRGSSGTIGAYYNDDSLINQGTISADNGGGGTWSYDHGYSDPYYSTVSTATAIDTSGVTKPAPQEVYQTARSDYQFGYTLTGLTPHTAYTLRLHFADFQASAAGQRLFDVSINGTQVLSNFDIFATAGGADKAVVEPFPVTTDANGRFTVNFSTDAVSNYNAQVNGLEIDDSSNNIVQTVNAGELALGSITVSPASFTNQGTVSATNDSTLTISSTTFTSPGVLQANVSSRINVTGGDLTLTPTSQVNIQVSGTTAAGYGQIVVTDNAALNGTLNIIAGSGFSLNAGDAINVMSFAGHTDNFTNVTGTTLGRYTYFVETVSDTDVTLTAALDASDLAASTMTVPATGIAGQNISLSYTVDNLSDVPVTGSWVDSLYLEPDATFDANATLLERVPQNMTVAAFGSYTVPLTVSLPGVLPGNYHLVLFADSRGLIPDANRANNVEVFPGTMQISIPSLNLGDTDSLTVANGQNIYYQVTIPAGHDVEFTADTGVAGSAKLYIRYGNVPSPSQYDEFAYYSVSQHQGISLSGATQGTYYILVQGQPAAGSGDGLSLSVHDVPFSITGVPASNVDTGNPFTVTLSGFQFTPTTTASLVSATGALIAAQSVTYVNRNTLYATFVVPLFGDGTYGVEVQQGASSSTLANVITAATQPNSGQATLSMSAPQYVRGTSHGIITVSYENDTGHDIPAPLLNVTATNALVRLPDQAVFQNNKLQFLGISSTGPAGVLTPGERGQLTIYFQVDITDPSSSVAFNLYPSLDYYNIGDIGTSQFQMDWASVKDAFRPPSISTDAWNAVWSNFLTSVGSNVAQFHTQLDIDANYLSQFGERYYDIVPLVDFEIARANDYLPGPTLASAIDAAAPTPGTPLVFSREFLQPISGRYQLGPLGRGWVDNWQTSLSVLGNRDVIVSEGGGDRFFTREANGSYQASPGDYGRLNLNGGVYTLREKDNTILTFNADGSLGSISDPNGNTVTAGYTNGQLTSLTSSDGQAIAITYNTQGMIQQVTAPGGQVTSYNYDSTGQYLLSVTDPTGTTSYTYVTGQEITQNNALASIGYPDGTHQYFSYDSQGRLSRTSRDDNTDAIQYGYPLPAGVTRTDASGATTTMLYNEDGSLEETIDPLGNTVQSQYDTNQNLTALTTAAGTEYRFTYNQAGDLIKTVNPLGDSVSMTYTPTLNQLASITDGDGNTTQFSYSSSGNLLSTTYADNSSTSATYNSLGLPNTTTNARGQATSYQYNTAGQVTQETFADGTQEQFTYNASGDLLTTTDATGVTTYHYNTANELTSVHYPSGQTLTYAYTGGRRTQLVDSTSGFTVNYNYDSAGRLQTLTDGTGAVLVTYQYNLVGELGEQDNANGTYTTYQYDADGNLLHLVNYGPGGVVQSRFDYTYDSQNQRTTETTLDGTWTYTYDGAGELTRAVFASTNPAVANQDLAYVYDAAGNRVKTIINGTTTTYTTNNRNEYTSVGGTTYQFDADGNLISEADSSGTTTFTYNSLNELTGVTTPTDTWVYQLNALGQRVGATHNGVSITYVLDPTGSGEVIAAYDSSGHVVADYAYGLGLVSQASPIGTDYYQFDGTGSTAGLTDSSGSLANSYSYLPFGGSLTSSETVANPFQFVGEAGVLNDGDGLYDMRARSYSATLGKFAANDPLGVLGSGSNLSSYAGNNPVSFADPSGLFYVDIGGTVGTGEWGWTGGIQIGSGGISAYGGVGVATPGASGSITFGGGNVNSNGTYQEIQGGIGEGVGVAGNVYQGIDGDAAGSSGWQAGVGFGSVTGLGGFVVSSVNWNPFGGGPAGGTPGGTDGSGSLGDGGASNGGDGGGSGGGGGTGGGGGAGGAPVPYNYQPADT